MRRISLALALYLCSSCDEPAVAPERLVSGSLPAARELSRETILIEQGFGGEGYGVHRLTYQLTPDDQLSIAYGLVTRAGPVVNEKFRLKSDEADRIREALWRLRPRVLASEWVGEWSARPLGCKMQGPHDQGEAVVAYISGENDDKGASFELPTAESCDTAAARQARRVLQQVFGSFPDSEIVTEFHKAESNEESWPDSLNPEPIPSLVRLT